MLLIRLYPTWVHSVLNPGETSKSELGGYLRVIYSRNDFKSEFLKNVSFTTKIDLFSNYTENPQNIDVNWEILIAMKVNKYLSVNFNTQLIYDDNIQIPLIKTETELLKQENLSDQKFSSKKYLELDYHINFNYQ